MRPSNSICWGGYTGRHISGTCKMGPASDPMAVVDQHGHVHGLQSLRVVDASIMPDCIRANTNVTTMIGERIAKLYSPGEMSLICLRVALMPDVVHLATLRLPSPGLHGWEWVYSSPLPDSSPLPP